MVSEELNGKEEIVEEPVVLDKEISDDPDSLEDHVPKEDTEPVVDEEQMAPYFIASDSDSLGTKMNPQYYYIKTTDVPAWLSMEVVASGVARVELYKEPIIEDLGRPVNLINMNFTIDALTPMIIHKPDFVREEGQIFYTKLIPDGIPGIVGVPIKEGRSWTLEPDSNYLIKIIPVVSDFKHSISFLTCEVL